MARDIQQRTLVVAVAVGAAVLTLLPTILQEKFTQKWFTKPIALGLDISGGVHLVYNVKASEAVTSRLQTTLQSVRADLRAKKIAVAQSNIGSDNSLNFTLASDLSLEEAKKVVTDKAPELTLSNTQIDAGRPRLTYTFSQKAAKEIEVEAVEQAVENLRSRVDQFGVTEPLIQRSGETRIILQMPGVSDVNAVKRVVGRLAKLEFRLVPRGTSTSGTTVLKGKDGESFIVEDQILMGGDSVADARVDFDGQGQVEVLLKLSSAGAQTFARITSENVGRQLAVVLDGIVVVAPTIKSAITDGNASISGGFTMDEAKDVKVALKAGALPAPLEVLEERTVGPTLGRESIKSGILAMAVGFVSISLFMIVYYLKSGVVAVVTLLLNAILMVGCLSLFGATLTLPGLAGLALTIGMAVDSNVIIFERIRDELRNGAGRNAAVAAGFDKAFGAIFDANVTTALAGVVLYVFGTGPIRGFAVTLSIGVVTTVFCAVYVARLLFDRFELAGKDKLSI